MTDDEIESTLDRFRTYLRELGPIPAAAPEPPAFEWAALAAQFTALRHDVNLQTRAVRAAVEALPKPEAAVPSEPWWKGIIEIADALTTAQKQVERSTAALEAALKPAPPRGFFARFAKAALPVNAEAILAGLGDGYALSLRRVDALLLQLGLERIDALDRPFDPETMEAMEGAPAGGRAPGTVVEEVRRGYRHDGRIVRFAMVKVAR